MHNKSWQHRVVYGNEKKSPQHKKVLRLFYSASMPLVFSSFSYGYWCIDTQQCHIFMWNIRKKICKCCLHKCYITFPDIEKNPWRSNGSSFANIGIACTSPALILSIQQKIRSSKGLLPQKEKAKYPWINKELNSLNLVLENGQNFK